MSNIPSSPLFSRRWDATAASFNSVNELLSGTYSSYSPTASSPRSLIIGGTAAASSSLREAHGKEGSQEKHLPDSMSNSERRSDRDSTFAALASPSPASFGAAASSVIKEDRITESFLTRGGGSFRKNGSIVLVGRVEGWGQGGAHTYTTTATSTISTYATNLALTTDEAGEQKVGIDAQAHLGDEEGPIVDQPKGNASNNNRAFPFAPPQNNNTNQKVDLAETSVLGGINCSAIGSDDGGPNARSTRPPSHHADPSTLVLQLDHGSSWTEEETSDRLEEGLNPQRTQSEGPTHAFSSSEDFDYFFSDSVCVEDAQQIERGRGGGRLLLASEKDGVRSVDPGTVPRSAFRSAACPLPSDVGSTQQNVSQWWYSGGEISGDKRRKDNKKDENRTNNKAPHGDDEGRKSTDDAVERRDTKEKMTEKEERLGNSPKGVTSASENIQPSHHNNNRRRRRAHSSPHHPMSLRRRLRLLDAHIRYIERLAEGAADLAGGSCGGGGEGRRSAECIALATQFIAQASESSTTQTTEISIFVGALSPSEKRWLNHMNAYEEDEMEENKMRGEAGLGSAHRLLTTDDYGCGYGGGTPRSGTGGARSWAWDNGDDVNFSSPNEALLGDGDGASSSFHSSSSSESFEGEDENRNDDLHRIDKATVAPIRFPSFFAGHLHYTARALHCLAMCLIGQDELASAGEALRLLWLAIEGKELVGGRDDNAAEHKDPSGCYSHSISSPSAASPPSSSSSPRQLTFSYRHHIDSNKVLQEYVSQAKAAGVPLYSSSGGSGASKSKASSIPASHSQHSQAVSVKMNPRILISAIEAVSSSSKYNFNYNYNSSNSSHGIVAKRLQRFSGNDEFPPMVRVGTHARTRRGANTTCSREGAYYRPSQPLLARSHALMPLHRTEYFSRNGSFFTLDNSILSSWRAKYEQAVGGWHLKRGEAAEAVLRFGNALRLLMTMTTTRAPNYKGIGEGCSGEGEGDGARVVSENRSVSVGGVKAHHWGGGTRGEKDGGAPMKRAPPPPPRDRRAHTSACTSAVRGNIESTVLSLRLKIADLLLQLGHEVSSDRILRDIECSLNEREAMEGTAAVAVSLGRVRRLRAAAEMKRGKISSAQLLLREIIGKMEEVLFVFTSAERELDEATELEALRRELLVGNNNKGAIGGGSGSGRDSGSGKTNTNECYESESMDEDDAEEVHHNPAPIITATATASGLTRADLKRFKAYKQPFLLELGQCHLMCSQLESCDDEGSGDGGGGFGLSSMGVAFERFHRGYTLLNIALSSAMPSLTSGRAGLVSSPPAADVLHPLIVRAQIQLAHMFIKRGVRDSVVLPLTNQHDASSSSSSHIAYSIRSGSRSTHRRGDLSHHYGSGVVGVDSDPDRWLSAVQRALLGLGLTPSSPSLGINQGSSVEAASSASSVVKLILLPQSTRKQERRHSVVSNATMSRHEDRSEGFEAAYANAVPNEEVGGDDDSKAIQRQREYSACNPFPSFSNGQKRREVIHEEGSAVPYLPFEECLSRSHTVLQGLLSALDDGSRRGAKVDHLRLEVLEACAEVSSNSGDFASAVGFYTQAIDLAVRLGDIRGGGVAEGNDTNKATDDMTNVSHGFEAHSKDDFEDRSLAVTNPWDAHVNASVFSLSVKCLIANIALIEVAEMSLSASSLLYGDGDDGRDRGDGEFYGNSFDWTVLSGSSFSSYHQHRTHVVGARRTEGLLPNAQACEAEARRLLKVAAATVNSTSSNSVSYSFSTLCSPTTKGSGSGGNKTLALSSLPEIVLWQCLASVYRLEGRWGEALDAYHKGITLCEEIETRQRSVLSSQGHARGMTRGNNNNDNTRDDFLLEEFRPSGVGLASGGGGANSNEVIPTSLADLDVVCASAVATLREILLHKAQLLDGASLTCRNEGVLSGEDSVLGGGPTLFQQDHAVITSSHSSFSSTHVCCDSNTMFATALRYSTAALIARSQALGRRSMLVSASHANVASIYHLLGRYRDAVASCEQCVSAVTHSLSDRLIHLPPVIPTNLFSKLSTMAGGLFAVDLPVSEEEEDTTEEKFVPYRSFGNGNGRSSGSSSRAAAPTIVALRMPRERLQEELLNYLILKHPFYRLSSRIKSECVLKMKRARKK